MTTGAVRTGTPPAPALTVPPPPQLSEMARFESIARFFVNFTEQQGHRDQSLERDRTCRMSHLQDQCSY